MRTAVAAMRRYSARRRARGLRMLGPLTVALLPSLIAVLAVSFGTDRSPFDLYRFFMVPLSLLFVVPFVTMFTMLPVTRELYEGGAVAYLYTRPTPRWAVLLGLFQGAFLAMLPALLAAALVPAVVLYGAGSFIPLQDWARVFGGLFATLALGGLSYGAVCLFLGIWSKRAILWAFFLLIIWGTVAGSLPGALRDWSLHHYLFGMTYELCGIDETWTGMFPPVEDPPGAALSAGILVGVTAAFFLLAALAAREKDVL